jgi:superfamily II DNA or RNA helicase
MWKDFADYASSDDSFDPNDVHRIYAGKEKESFRQRVVITTWQSVFKMPRNWFEDYEMVVGDEAHLFKAKSLTTIMGHLRNAWLRIGTTGTLDGTKVHKLVLEGAFGPTYNVTSTKKLIESNTLSDLSIDVLGLTYSDQEKKAFGKKTYQEEISYITQHEKRNNFIRNLALAQEGNTLVLFNLVEGHGKPLYNLIKEKANPNRKVFFVSGEVGAVDREQIRELVEKEKDAIIVASLGTFSTGINIKNLHNMVFAAPTKSQVRVLQSIGRSLRKAENGQPAKVYDICDDLSWKSRKNYTLQHGVERVKIYAKEQLKFKTHQVPIN